MVDENKSALCGGGEGGVELPQVLALKFGGK